MRTCSFGIIPSSPLLCPVFFHLAFIFRQCTSFPSHAFYYGIIICSYVCFFYVCHKTSVVYKVKQTLVESVIAYVAVTSCRVTVANGGLSIAYGFVLNMTLDMLT
uniref:Uncharacterized protein n=1 Tax=Rhipicephalus microplus TaxID=6941 RepID=A0A6M2DC56_RHIMP